MAEQTKGNKIRGGQAGGGAKGGPRGDTAGGQKTSNMNAGDAGGQGLRREPKPGKLDSGESAGSGRP